MTPTATPFKFRLAGVLLIGALLANVACTSDQLTTSLDTAVSAAEIALPIVAGAAGMPAGLSAQLGDYLAAVGTAADKSVTILADKNLSDVQRGAAVSAAFADAIAQSALIKNLPAGTPAKVIGVVTAVVDAVNRFLSHLQIAQNSMSTPAMAMGFTSSGPTHLKIERGKLAKIQARARALANKKK